MSPEDCKLLVDGRTGGRTKLAGTSFGHFGAFLLVLWRENDVLWERLVAAERLVAILLPDHPKRDELTRDAQAEILYEQALRSSKEELQRMVAESFLQRCQSCIGIGASVPVLRK